MYRPRTSHCGVVVALPGYRVAFVDKTLNKMVGDINSDYLYATYMHTGCGCWFTTAGAFVFQPCFAFMLVSCRFIC